ncbi:MAG: HAD-IB family hydrolase [Ilumatobacteraceae bacterium]
MTGSTTVAAFDLDGTLTTRDSVVPFMCAARGPAALGARLAVRGHRLVVPLARRDRDGVKAVATGAAFAGLAEDDLLATGRSFAERVAEARSRADTAARLAWHRDAGHRVVIVSASYEVYLRRLGELLGAHAVLGTRLEVVEHRCTGHLRGPNCRGPEKVRRLHQWLDEHHGGRAAVELWAYGDSPGDRELLADADHAVWADGVLPRVPGRDRSDP